MSTTPGDVASSFGKGLFAGLAGKATATDLLHHAVYATATGLAYSYLDRSGSR